MVRQVPRVPWHPGDSGDSLNLGRAAINSLRQQSARKIPPPRARITLTPNQRPDSRKSMCCSRRRNPDCLKPRPGYGVSLMTVSIHPTPVWSARKQQWIEPRARREVRAGLVFLWPTGRDYSRVLREYAQLCGPVPMIPQAMFLGPMVTDFQPSKYFPDSAQAARAGVPGLQPATSRETRLNPPARIWDPIRYPRSRLRPGTTMAGDGGL